MAYHGGRWTYEEHLRAWREICANEGHGPEICPDCDAKRIAVWEGNKQARAERHDADAENVAALNRLRTSPAPR